MNLMVNRHRLWQLVADAGLIAAAWYLAFQLRFDFNVPPTFEEGLLATTLLVVAIKLAVFVALGFYNRWWRYVSTKDMWRAALGVLVASVLAALAIYFGDPFERRLPRGVVLMDFVLLLGFVAGSRLAARTIFERPTASSLVARGKEVIVVGAGDAGQLVIREMQRSRQLGYTPIGLVDDDPRKKNLRVHGVRVLGRTDELPHVLRDNRPDELLIAIPSASGEDRQKIVEIARREGVAVKTLPGLYELIADEENLAGRIRPVQVEDVLGREPVEVDIEAISEYLRDETVLVTGAGGSIGSELCRQISRCGPARLVLVDQAETPLFEIERELVDERQFTASIPVLADVSNRTRMRHVFERYRPGVVFHSAAYKHVPLMEANPLESVRNNVLATKVVADTAVEYDAKRFVLISTDKALNPKAVYGQCKALCEWIVEAYGCRADVPTRFVAVRFGNVLGSAGSVITIFKRQIEQGGPVTITHPEMTRYFMTIPEAVVAGRPGRVDRRRRRDLRARHGRAGLDPRARPRHDPALRQGARAGHPVQLHRREGRREAPRRAVGRGRGDRLDGASEDPAGQAQADQRRVAGRGARRAGAIGARRRDARGRLPALDDDEGPGSPRAGARAAGRAA